MIQILDSYIADKIAAGEVIERPLSIVKELVENAIDAGANRIIVEIRGGGKSYIRVTDNGCGIPAAEVPLAFERHATGKIRTLEDLDHISTLGFRGEALASICAISRLTIFTRTQDEAIGTRLEIQGGRCFEPEPAGVNVGTTMLVEDVFYNTPARRKFMRSDAAEASAIIDFVQKMAIYYAGISFQMMNNGKNIFTTPGTSDYQSVITRIYPSRDFAHLLEIQGTYVHGYISDPGTTRTNRSGQIYFVNGRYVQSDVIEKGLMDGYGDRIFSGYPIAVLFITVPPESIDVNIHPNKKEIKFLEAKEIKQDIADAVRSVFYTEESIPGTQGDIRTGIEPGNSSGKSDEADGGETIFGREAAGRNGIPGQEPKERTEQLGIREFLRNKEHAASPHAGKDVSPHVGKDMEHATSLYDGKDVEHTALARCGTAEFAGEEYDISGRGGESKSAGEGADAGMQYTALHTTNTEVVYDEGEPSGKDIYLRETEAEYPSASPELSCGDGESIPLAPPTTRLFDFGELQVCGYVFNAYIITRAGDNLFVLDQHAAHERILYEKLVRQYNRGEHLPQPILTPILLNTSSDVYCGERKWMDILRRIGYDIEDFGTNTFIIRGIPACMELSEADTFARETMEIQENEIHLHRNTPVVDKLIMKSCKSAVKANDHLSDEEIRQLLTSLSQCINPFSCPHGRPTFIRISKYEIERAFRRK